MRTGRYGLYHVTNAGPMTWYEFAKAIFESGGVQADLTPTTSREFGAAVPRPGYSVLDNSELVAAGVPALRPARSDRRISI